MVFIANKYSRRKANRFKLFQMFITVVSTIDSIPYSHDQDHEGLKLP
jgi:hypothetical protein